MTRTGVFMRRSVRLIDSFHCAPVMRSARPESSAATNTPVPAADSQLIVKRAASGFALAAAIGGIRCTRLWSAGMSQAGSESVPPKFEPRRGNWNFTPEKRLLRVAFQVGMPQIAQQAMRIAHGSQA